MKRTVLAVIVSLVVINLSVYTVKTEEPSLSSMTRPVDDGPCSVEPSEKDQLNSHFEKKKEFGIITETTITDLSAMTFHNYNLHSFVIFTPMRALPLWGSDIRVDYFTFNPNCLYNNEECEFFHATQETHWWSSYRLVPSASPSKSYIQLDYVDLVFSMVALTLIVLAISTLLVIGLTAVENRIQSN